MRLSVFAAGDPTTAKSGPPSPGNQKWDEILLGTLATFPPFSHSCRVRLEFLLAVAPGQDANPNNRYGGDIDNLAHVVLDALAKTVLKHVGGDGAVLELWAEKRFARNEEETGVWITITEHSAPPH